MMNRKHDMQRDHVGAKILWAGLCVLGMMPLSFPLDAHAQAMADYTSIPPFIADAVPPNVLLLMDNSGSMNSSAYHNADEAYNSSKDYNGYFSPTKCYSYASNKFTPGADKAASGNPCSAGAPWLGSFLNYLTMTRLEITKWVMMGGKCAPRALAGTCFPGGTLTLETTASINFIDVNGTGISPYAAVKCFDRSGNSLTVKASGGCGGTADSYTLKAEIAAEPDGIIQTVGNKARFGLMQFKGAGDGGQVLADVGAISPPWSIRSKIPTPQPIHHWPNRCMRPRVILRSLLRPLPIPIILTMSPAATPIISSLPIGAPLHQATM